jgi:hypothetical protein
MSFVKRRRKILGANYPLGAIVKTLLKNILRDFQKLRNDAHP